MITTRRLVPGLTTFIVLTLALAGRSSAAEIVGRVALSGVPAADVVVSIEGVRLAGIDAKTYVLDHRDLAFVPHVIAVRAGTTVQFDNTDGMPCYVYSISPAGTFLLRPRPSHPVSITFDRLGIIEVRCAQHGDLVGYIVVKENPYFALSDANGDYRIERVPAGRYVLQATYEGQVLETRTVEVSTDRTRVDFATARPVPRVLNNFDSLAMWRPEP